MPKYDYALQVQEGPRSDGYRGATMTAAGGLAFIMLAGTSKKADIFAPRDGGAIANPVPFVNGKLTFATDVSVTVVDIYGFSPNGGFFYRRGIRPNHEPEITLDTDQVQHTLILPFDARDYTAGQEVDTKIQLPVGSLVFPTPSVQVLTPEASRTLNVGLLSTETGGDADGFMVGVSLATAGIKKATTATTATIGALLLAGSVPEPAPISTARTISFTLSASSASGAGVIYLPYQRPVR